MSTDLLWRPPARPGPPRTAELPQRPATILSGLCLGLSTRQIARELHITEHTVKTHVRRLFAELGAHDRVDAVALALSGHVRITVTSGSRTPTPQTGRP